MRIKMSFNIIIFFIFFISISCGNNRIKIIKLDEVYIDGNIYFSKDTILFYNNIDSTISKVELDVNEKIIESNVENIDQFDGVRFFNNAPPLFKFNADTTLDTLNINEIYTISVMAIKQKSLICKNLIINIYTNNNIVDWYRSDCVGAVGDVVSYNSNIFYLVTLSQGGSGYSLGVEFYKIIDAPN